MAQMQDIFVRDSVVLLGIGMSELARRSQHRVFFLCNILDRYTFSGFALVANFSAI
jgi:hypothetical protein